MILTETLEPWCHFYQLPSRGTAHLKFHHWVINSRCVKELSKLTLNHNPSFLALCLGILPDPMRNGGEDESKDEVRNCRDGEMER